MTSIDKLIESLQDKSESYNIEAKLCSEGISDGIYDTIVAFSNTLGGTIICGVDPISYEVTGVLNPQKIQDEITSTCRNSQYYNLILNPKIHIENYKEKKLVCIEIEEALKKPIYYKSKGLPKGCYKRINGSNIVCTDEDIRELYMNNTNRNFDQNINTNTSSDDIDDELIQYYKHLKSKINPKSSELFCQSTVDFLKSLNCVDNSGKINNTGLLLFGKKQSICHYFPYQKVEFIISEGKIWVEDPTFRFKERHTFHDSLIRMIIDIQETIKDKIRTRFAHSDDIESTEIPVVPLKAINEAVTNAIIHRNYEKNIPISIYQFSNRLVIQNPGKSIKPIEKLEEPGSRPRNPRIADIFQKINFAETLGTGIRTMILEMEKAKLEKPLFESDPEDDFFRVTFFTEHLLDDLTQECLRKFSHLKLNQDDKLALAYILKIGSINNKRYRSINKVDITSASKGLKRLVEWELIRQKGTSRKKAEYVITEKLSEAYR